MSITLVGKVHTVVVKKIDGRYKESNKMEEEEEESRAQDCCTNNEGNNVELGRRGLAT